MNSTAATSRELRICSRCIYDTRISNITFDAEGVCNYCHQVESLVEMYGTGTPRGEAQLQAIIDEIKQSGRGRKYDCVIGVSGGTDSSYLLCKAIEWGLRPLAVHYDNTWNAAVATQNIQAVTKAADVDLFTYVVDNVEVDEIKRAFLLAGVPEFDADTDLAYVQVCRMAAAKYGVRHILEGHSFITEGISPVGDNYLDGAYIADICRRFGRMKRRGYPLMSFWQFMKWILVYKQKFIRPLWYVHYSKEEARDMLVRDTGWRYYGGHHLENRASKYAHTVWLPQRFNIDYRNLSLAASVRRGALTRSEALEIYNTALEPDPELEAYIRKRARLSEAEYAQCMTAPKRTFRDFRTYKKRFERLRPLFAVLAKANLVPMSFYLKYCLPMKASK